MYVIVTVALSLPCLARIAFAPAVGTSVATIRPALPTARRSRTIATAAVRFFFVRQRAGHGAQVGFVEWQLGIWREDRASVHVELSTLSSVTATRRPTDGQERLPPTLAPVLVHAPAPPVGSVELMRSPLSVRKQRPSVGEETLRCGIRSPPRDSTHQPHPVGSVEVSTPPSLSIATHRLVDGHDTALSGLVPSMSSVFVHALAPPVGSVEVKHIAMFIRQDA